MSGDKKICILYHYYEKDKSYKKNLSHFLEFGVTDRADLYLILAGGHCSLEIAPSDNLVVVKADNKNYDYGGYSEVLSGLVDSSKYEYFFFVNSSVRGPFIPPYVVNDKDWHDYFLELFSDDVGLVGASINILNKASRHHGIYQQFFGESSLLAHVQTPVFALRWESLKLLEKLKFFDTGNAWSRDEVVSRYEINLSRVIINSGWNIKCLLPEFNQFDYRAGDLDDICPDYFLGDTLFEGKYLGRTVHPYEIMFIKTGRGLWPASYLETLSMSMGLAKNCTPQGSYFGISSEITSSNEIWFTKKPPIFVRLYRYLKRMMS